MLGTRNMKKDKILLLSQSSGVTGSFPVQMYKWHTGRRALCRGLGGAAQSRDSEAQREEPFVRMKWLIGPKMAGQ